MHPNDATHQALEVAHEIFKNIEEGHVPQDRQIRSLACGLRELTAAMMNLNAQIHDLEDSIDPGK